MSNYIQIDGVIETPNNINADDFIDLFLTWIEEEHKSYFGGYYCQVDENGDEINEKIS
jgi:hypothetical protein